VAWFATRSGRKRFFLVCIVGFTLASCCAARRSRAQIGCSLLQGMFQRGLVPLSQTILLDIYPAERRGFAMAIWGTGVMDRPDHGPDAGGYLTEALTGAMCFTSTCVRHPRHLGLLAGCQRHAGNGCRFDWLGFTCCRSDRRVPIDAGPRQDQDWFSATEIITEAGCNWRPGIYLVRGACAMTAATDPPCLPPRQSSTGFFEVSRAG